MLPGRITPITKQRKIHIQQIVVILLYFARAVDSNMLVSLEYIASHKTESNKTTSQAIKQILDYCATHPYATIWYKESDMVIYVHSGDIYLSKSHYCI